MIYAISDKAFNPNPLLLVSCEHKLLWFSFFFFFVSCVAVALSLPHPCKDQTGNNNHCLENSQ